MTEPDFDNGVEFPDATGNVFLMRLKYGRVWLYHRHNNGPWKETREATEDEVKRWLELGAKELSEVQFYPDEGFPLSVGYMVGKDDGASTLYTTPERAVEAWEDQAGAQDRTLFDNRPI